MRARSISSTSILGLVVTVLAMGCSSGRERLPSEPRSSGDSGVGSDGGAGLDGGIINGACTTSAECGAGVCDRAQGRCVGCRHSDECGSGQRCETGSCVASEVCDGDLACTQMGRVCDTAGARCVACNSAADCPSGPCLGHSCFDNPSCTSSLECADLMMVCADVQPPAWPAEFLGQGCAECDGNNDCGLAEACESNFCANVCGDRVCGAVQGADCGSCAGGALCAPDGMACFEFSPAGYQAEEFVVIDGTILAWNDGRNTGSARLWATSLAGTGAATLLFQGQGGAYLDGVTMAGPKVYAALTDGSILSGTTQGRLSVFGQVPGADTSDSVWCQGLAGHEAFVICALVDYDNTIPNGLYRIPIDGGRPALIDTISQPDGLFTWGNDVLWSDFNGVQVGKSGLITGNRTVLERVQARLVGVKGGYLYYDSTNSGLRRSAIDGSGASAVTSEPERWQIVGFDGDRILLVEKRASELVLYDAALDGTNTREVINFGVVLPAPSSRIHVERYQGQLYLVTSAGVLKIVR